MSKAIVTKYLEAWNEREDETRRSALTSCFASNGTYVDPHVPQPASSITEMDTIIKTLQTRLPHQLITISEPEFHHHVFRVQWKLEDEGSTLSRGVFIGEFNSDHKIQKVISFINA